MGGSVRQRPLIGVLASLVLVLALAYALAGERGDGEQSIVVDERAGVVAGVSFGATERQVRALLGEPSDGEPGFFPAGSTFTGPPGIASPPGRTEELHYPDLAFLVSAVSGVYSMAVLAEGASTRAGVAVGSSLARVGSQYPYARCGHARLGEPRSGGPPPTYPWCRAVVGDVRLFFGGDPIRSITLTSYAHTREP